MPNLTRREILALLLTAPAVTTSWSQETSAPTDWIPLFDGKSLDG